MNVLITGASGGIGSAIARRFLDEGYNVTGIDRQAAAIEHPRYTHFSLDIRDEAALPPLKGSIYSSTAPARRTRTTST